MKQNNIFFRYFSPVAVLQKLSLPNLSLRVKMPSFGASSSSPMAPIASCQRQCQALKRNWHWFHSATVPQVWLPSISKATILNGISDNNKFMMNPNLIY